MTGYHKGNWTTCSKFGHPCVAKMLLVGQRFRQCVFEGINHQKLNIILSSFAVFQTHCMLEDIYSVKIRTPRYYHNYNGFVHIQVYFRTYILGMNCKIRLESFRVCLSYDLYSIPYNTVAIIEQFNWIKKSMIHNEQKGILDPSNKQYML